MAMIDAPNVEGEFQIKLLAVRVACRDESPPMSRRCSPRPTYTDDYAVECKGNILCTRGAGWISHDSVSQRASEVTSIPPRSTRVFSVTGP